MRNAVGWSDYSPIGYLRTADVPSAPPAPTTVSASSTEIALVLYPSADRGGAEITGYELWIDDGALGESFTRIESYDGKSQNFVMELALETALEQGKIYRIKYLAKNEIGPSEFSDLISVSFSDLPSKPSTPTKNISLSTDVKLVIDWDFVADTQLPGGLITNYRIFMDNGDISGDFREIYTASSSLKQFSVGNLKRGTLYRFKVQAKNFNGWGEASDIGAFYTCVKPSGLDIVTIIGTTSDSMTLQWKEPKNDGGCQIVGYALFRDDGVSGDPTIEINTDNDAAIRGKPTLRTAIANFNQADLGTKFAF